jgi:uncharacterized protein YndB with AHSA1/START domain
VARTDTARRVIAADAEHVYRCLVDPDALVAWLPPRGMTGSLEHFDARPGGSFRLVLTYTDGTGARGKSTADADVVDATFVELSRASRVVFTVEFASDDPAFAGTMTMTWTMTPADGGTEVTVIAADVPGGISAEDHSAGMASSLEQLADYLEDSTCLRDDRPR